MSANPEAPEIVAPDPTEADVIVALTALRAARERIWAQDLVRATANSARAMLVASEARSNG